MNRPMIRQALNVVAVAVTLIVNTLATTLPLNGQTTGSISDRFPVLFTPAGYVFAIWSLIYLGLIAFAVYQALPAQRDNARLAAISGPFLLSNIANSVWIFLWHYNLFPLSLVVMLVLLGSLITIYLRLGIGRVAVVGWEKWAVTIPFSVYLGWITVATIANTTIVLYDLGWNGAPLGPEVWTLIVFAAVLVIALAMALLCRDIAYLLVLVWALVGIWVKQAATPVVANAALVTAALVAAFIVLAFVRDRRLPASVSGPETRAAAKGRA